MIETIKVTDVHIAKEISGGYHGGNHTAWISTLDPEDEHFMYNIKRKLERRGIFHFGLYFKDMDDGAPEADFEGPCKEDVEKIINFWTGLKSQDRAHHVGVNCYAGIARSTAVAMIGWMIQGYQPEVALDKVLFVRSVAWPNERILRLYDEITGSNAQEVVLKWKAEKRSNPSSSIYLTLN